jgi:hypothetical protein
MALFNDGFPSEMEDLVDQDSQLLEVASGEGIDTTRKLALAQEELGIEIRFLLDRHSPGPPLANVVVTPLLRLWHTYRTLEMIYADAFFSALNDRYRNKRDQFHGLVRWSYDKLIDAGIGIVYDPLPQPAIPSLAASPGSLAADSYFAAVTWLNSGREEGALSHPDTISLVTGTFSVTPPAAPPNATGWNLYAGNSPETVVLQNASPLPLNGIWIQSSAVLTSGQVPGSGQTPNYFQPVPQFIQRG